MKLDTVRFGEIEINDESIITFPSALPGLDGLHRYAVVRCEPTEPIQWLQSIENTEISLPVINPFIVKDDYEIEVEDVDLDIIKSYDESDLLVMAIMVVQDDLSQMTVNLMAPLLVNLRTMLGVQVLMDHTDYPVDYAAFNALVDYYQRDDEEAGVDAGIVEKA